MNIKFSESQYRFAKRNSDAMRELMEDANELATEDGIIFIQSCDSSTANVGITTGNLTCYRRVSVPSLTQAEESRFYPWEMSDEKFAAILGKHAAAVVEMIDRLNTKGDQHR